MPVYVDDMCAPYGRLKMCHMLASSDQELHEMADRIGVARKWWQAPAKGSGRPPAKGSGSHYDIALSKKALALAAGAIPITFRQAGAMNARRRVEGVLGNPDEAFDWLLAYRARRRQELEVANATS